MSSEKSLVIAIAGATRSGKSFVTRGIVDLLQKQHTIHCDVVHQDHFLRSGETPDAVDWRSFCGAIQRAIAGQPQPRQHAAPAEQQTSKAAGVSKRKSLRVVIVEGFLVFAKPTSTSDVCSALASLFDVKLFLALSKEECYARRKATKRAGLHGAAFDNVFEKTIWPAHVEFGQPPEDATVLDGSKAPDALVEEAIKVILEAIEVK